MVCFISCLPPLWIVYEKFFLILIEFGDMASTNLSYRAKIKEKDCSTLTFPLSNFLLKSLFGFMYIYKA